MINDYYKTALAIELIKARHGKSDFTIEQIEKEIEACNGKIQRINQC